MCKGSVSDDDKIRLQLYLDVWHFLRRLCQDFSVDQEDVRDSSELLRVVEDATSGLMDIRRSLGEAVG